MAEPVSELGIPLSSHLIFIHEGNQAMKQHLQCSTKKRSVICVQIHTSPFLTCSMLSRLHCLGRVHLPSGRSSRREAPRGAVRAAGQ